VSRLSIARFILSADLFVSSDFRHLVGFRGRLAAPIAWLRSSPSSTKLRPDADGNARTTRSVPEGRSARCDRTRWRRRRLTLLRTTAPPTVLETTNPARAGGSLPRARAGLSRSSRLVDVRIARCTTMPPRATRRPALIVAANSSRRRRRSAAASTGLLRREAGATLGPAVREDRAAGTGAHAQPEAVGLRATAVVRLIGALAHVRHSVFMFGGLGFNTVFGFNTVQPITRLEGAASKTVRAAGNDDDVSAARTPGDNSTRTDRATCRAYAAAGFPSKPTNVPSYPHRMWTTCAFCCGQRLSTCGQRCYRARLPGRTNEVHQPTSRANLPSQPDAAPDSFSARQRHRKWQLDRDPVDAQVVDNLWMKGPAQASQRRGAAT